jgi:predicted metalloprotease with PDZ domain
VSGLLRDTPAYGSGLATDDELIAIDDFCLGVGGLDTLLDRYHPGDKVSLVVSRCGELRRLGLTLGSAPSDRWLLSVRPEATPEQLQRLTAWLGR